MKPNLTEKEELLLCVNTCARELDIPFLVVGALHAIFFPLRPIAKNTLIDRGPSQWCGPCG